MGIFNWLFPNNYDIKLIKRGMTRNEVKELFGNPWSAEGMRGEGFTETWFYTDGRTSATVEFDHLGVREVWRRGSLFEDRA